jgi:hypothetical protein
MSARMMGLAGLGLVMATSAFAQGTKTDTSRRSQPATKSTAPATKSTTPATKSTAAPASQAAPTSTKQVAPAGTKQPTTQTKTPSTQTKATTPPAPQTKATTPPAPQTKATTPPAGQAKTTTPPAGQAKTTTPPAGQAKANPPAAQNKVAPPPAGQAKAVTPPVQAPAGTAPAGRGVPAPGAVTRRDSSLLGPPVVLMREVFEYDRDGRRDPFISLLTTTDLRPTLSDLKLLMTVVDEPGRSIALVSDAYDKKQPQKTLRVGTRVGRMRVSSIRADVVVFTIEEFGMNRRDSLLLRDTTQVRGR